MPMQLESADLVPGDSFLRNVEIDDGGQPLVGYTAEAKLIDAQQTTALTDPVQMQQGTGNEWLLDIPPSETIKVPQERGAVFLQVRVSGPTVQTGWAQLTVRPAV